MELALSYNNFCGFFFMFKKILLFIVLVSIVLFLIFAFSNYKNFKNKFNVFPNKQTVAPPVLNTTTSFLLVKKRALQLKKYLHKNNYNDSICFIVNMAVPSGKPRFFVYDFLKDTIIQSGLVTHGSGSNGQNGKFVFKNFVNCNASSNGKYKIGESYNGKFGLAYKLYGLDSTNNKAFERFVVLHSHSCVPNKNVYPSNICESRGCPTVAPSFLQILQPLINKSSKPIILDIGYIAN